MKRIVLNFPNVNFSDMVSKIRSFIKRTSCKELEADISLLNLVDASKTALLCSAYHFAKYPDGKISWEVADEPTKQIINTMKLKNMELMVKDGTVELREGIVAAV